MPTFGNQYLFKGDYQGTQASGSYGIYVEVNRHYLTNNLGIGNADPQAYLHVGGATPVGAEALIVRGDTDASYAVSIEQDHATGWGMIIDSDSTSAGFPVTIGALLYLVLMKYMPFHLIQTQIKYHLDL